MACVASMGYYGYVFTDKPDEAERCRQTVRRSNEGHGQDTGRPEKDDWETEDCRRARKVTQDTGWFWKLNLLKIFNLEIDDYCPLFHAFLNKCKW